MSAAAKSAMPSGMASMLKMFGVDPTQIIEAAKKTGEAVKQIAESIERIELNQVALNRKLDRIARKLAIEEEENGGRELCTVGNGNGAGKNGR